MTGARIPVKTRLRHWKLTRVPFPSVPFVSYFNEDPLINGAAFAPELRQEQIDQIRIEVLGNGWPDAVTRWNWVWAHKHIGGSIGMGKSALLGYVTDQINMDFGSSFFHRAAPWLAVYVQVPKKARTTAEVMAAALASVCDPHHGVSVERRLVGRLRHRVAALNVSRQYPAGLSAEPETKFADDNWLESQGVQLETLNKGVADLLRHAGVRAAVANAVASCALQSLVGGFQDAAVPIHTKETPQLLLTEVAKIAHAADLLHVTLILDDFYFLVKNSKPGDREALAFEWRDIVVDGDYRATRSNFFNWVAVMHTKTAGGFNQAWEDAGMHNFAPLFVKVGDVIARPGVHLQALPRESARRLLESYTKFSRFGRASSVIFPFAEEAVDYMLEIARQKGQEQEGKCDPRSLLEVARAVFVRALFDVHEHAEIDLAFARHVLEGIPLPEPAKTVSADVVEAADEAAVMPIERRMPLSVTCACGCHLEDGTSADDLVALVSGEADEGAPEIIIGYRCLNCNAPVLAAG